MRQTLLVSLLILISVHAAGIQAEEQSVVVEKTVTELPTSIASVEEQARRWGITAEEYRRFQDAMEGPRGRFGAPNITPIEVLGIEAESTAERQRFAELWVETIRNDTAKVLAFSREVSTTWRRLHGQDPLLDRSYINIQRLKSGKRLLPTDGHPSPLANQSQVKPADHLLLFTETACDSCSADVARLVSQLENGSFARLDVFLLDVADGDVAAIQSWAASLAIPPGLVQTGKLTLNFDGGAYQGLAESMQFTPAKFPVVIRRNGEGYDLVSLQ